ncbi:MAG: polysaccharide biosynthesis protein [Lachnospiraceae bacterium]|nr:polysaccharide biosynthesis protein [Lachnospiraceae bacterium]
MMKALGGRLFNGRYNRKWTLAVFDLICCILVALFYYELIYKAAFRAAPAGRKAFLLQAGLQTGLVLLLRTVFGIYGNIWRYDNAKAYLMLVIADGTATTVAYVILRLTVKELIISNYLGGKQAIIIGTLICLLALSARFAYSVMYKRYNRRSHVKEKTPVAIVGAGQLGVLLAEDLKENPNSSYKPAFFIDKDDNKVNYNLVDCHVYSEKAGDERIQLEHIRDVIIAISSADAEKLSQLYHHYSDLGCRVRVYDTLVSAESSQQREKPAIRDFTVEDLLFRSPLNVESEESFSYYRGKTVMVTGGGGSIGSELCRQLVKCKPKKLIIFDIYENNAYDIQQELVRRYGSELDMEVVIGSVRDAARVNAICKEFRPQVIFHAAAHKHVPLMEYSAGEAVKNNVCGTYNMANAAELCGAEKFILISTDKAVNPTNIMGASKRMCEMIVQSRTDSATSFAAVRFGNVLGSNGSVIPLFKKQIAEGGPVTITDKRIVRYFMTIPEATQLVMQAGAMAKNGELYVLDMGKPVKIYDLAKDVIRMSGLEPEKDIEIREIGLRPGEKLYEELLMKSETLSKTENDMIFIEKDKPYSRAEVARKMEILCSAIDDYDMGGKSMKKAFSLVIPTYREAEVVNREAEKAPEMNDVNTADGQEEKNE